MYTNSQCQGSGGVLVPGTNSGVVERKVGLAMQAFMWTLGPPGVNLWFIVPKDFDSFD